MLTEGMKKRLNALHPSLATDVEFIHRLKIIGSNIRQIYAQSIKPFNNFVK